MLDRQVEGYIIKLLKRLDELNNNLKKISKALEKDKEEKSTKKLLIEDYTTISTPLEPVPWYVHSPQYNRNPFTSDISGLGNSLTQYNFNIPSLFGDKDEQ